MRRLFYAICLLLAVSCGQNAGDTGSRDYIIGFYNVENLFDTKDDPATDDSEFLPWGKYRWDDGRYRSKLHNIASVIGSMAADNGCFHTVLGLAEIENEKVLKDLLSQSEIADAGYEYVHYDSSDPRGIDVALLYRPEEFKFISSECLHLTQKGRSIRTRDVLMVHGKIENEEFAVYVAHLPSRNGGKGKDTRCSGAELIYRHSQKMSRLHPGIRIVVMGDMNDDPVDESQVKWLHARETIEETGENDFFSPFITMLKEGFGSLEYKGVWNIFDIIEVNRALASPSDRGLRIKPGGKGYYGNIYRPSFLTTQQGKYKGTPLRTFSGNKFLNGYSDHYPTYIIIGK